MANPIPHLPYIDPNVDHVDAKKFRHMPPHKLKALDRTTVLRDDDVPLAVLVPYNTFLEIQDELSRLKETIGEYEFPDLNSLWDDSLDSARLDEFDDLDEDDEDQSKDDEDRSKLVDFKGTAVDESNSKDAG